MRVQSVLASRGGREGECDGVRVIGCEGGEGECDGVRVIGCG